MIKGSLSKCILTKSFEFHQVRTENKMLNHDWSRMPQTGHLKASPFRSNSNSPWIWRFNVPITEYCSWLFLETVRCLFPIPNCSRQGKLATDSILSNCTKWSTTNLFRFNIMSTKPEILKPIVIKWRKLSRFEQLEWSVTSGHFPVTYLVKFSEISSKESRSGLGLQNGFIIL